MKHFMRLHDRYFQKILIMEKDIELRLFDEKRRTISIGDTVLFTNRTTGDFCERLVVDLIIANTFSEAISDDNLLLRSGFTPEDNIDEIMSSYYSEKDVSRYGVVGIVLGD